jgi:hypothetical protein
VQAQDGSSMPRQSGESRIIKLTSPGGTADPPVHASHLWRNKSIDSKEVNAGDTPLQEQELKVLFRWAT